MKTKILKSLRDDADYSLQICLLGREEYSGKRKLLDIADMRAGVLFANDYHYAQFDFIVMGVNPVINILTASLLAEKGFSVFVSTNRMQDSWDYNIFKNIDFQKRLSLKFKTGYRFLKESDEDKRCLVFLEDLFSKVKEKYVDVVYVSNSDIVLSNNQKYWNGYYALQSQLGLYKDNLPFNKPMIGDESLYNKSFNLFYKYFSERENNWDFYSDTEKQTQKTRYIEKIDDESFYYVLAKKALLTSHYHPYLKESDFQDDDVFKFYENASLEKLTDWIDKQK